MLYPFRHQPMKAAYLTYQVFSTLLIRVPVWLMLSIPRSWRPRYSWSMRRVVWVQFIRHISAVVDETGPLWKSPNHLAITPGANVEGVWVEAVPNFITGELRTWAAVSSVSSIRVPGYWTHKVGTTIKVAEPPMPGEKVIYSLHGGGYTQLSAHPSDIVANIVYGLLAHVDSIHRVFSLEYRLSVGKPLKPAHPFPAALLDAVAGYNYLVNVVGFSPSDIIVEGDSAGGNLALALTRYLVEYQSTPDINLPAPPNALILLSPWCDVGTSHDAPETSSFLKSDVERYKEVDDGKEAFLGPHGLGAAEINRYISPASLHPSMTLDFKGFPRTFITAGGAELSLDQIRVLKERMANDLGEGNGMQEGEGKVRYYEAKDAVHDYLVFTWHEPEREETFREIAKWVSGT